MMKMTDTADSDNFDRARQIDDILADYDHARDEQKFCELLRLQLEYFGHQNDGLYRTAGTFMALGWYTTQQSLVHQINGDGQATANLWPALRSLLERVDRSNGSTPSRFAFQKRKAD